MRESALRAFLATLLAGQLVALLRGTFSSWHAAVVTVSGCVSGVLHQSVANTRGQAGEIAQIRDEFLPLKESVSGGDGGSFTSVPPPLFPRAPTRFHVLSLGVLVGGSGSEFDLAGVPWDLHKIMGERDRFAAEAASAQVVTTCPLNPLVSCVFVLFAV